MAKTIPKKSKSSAKKKPYLSKRVLERAVSKGTRNISGEAMRRRGHILTAKDGWLVKVNLNGTEEKISKLPKTKTLKNIVLD